MKFVDNISSVKLKEQILLPKFYKKIYFYNKLGIVIDTTNRLILGRHLPTTFV